MNKKIAAILVLLFLSVVALAQKNRIKFDKISLAQGLSQSTVLSILQDNKGFMWFATLDGLNKYDGYTITAYRHQREDPFSIPDNAINIIFEDSHGTLWVGTRSGGLAWYDKLRDKFITIQHTTGDSSSLCSNNVTSIYEDKYHNLWIGTNNGVSLLKEANRNEQIFVNFFNDPNNDNSLVNNYINHITGDDKGNIWIATNDGINYYNPATDQFSVYRSRGTDSAAVRINTVNTIFIDTAKEIWFGSELGLAMLQPETGKLKRHYYSNPANENTLSNDIVTSIVEDSAGVLWLGTEKGGLNRFDPKTEEFTAYKHDPANQNSLSVDNIQTLFIDKASILWVGTSLGGVNKWNRAAEDLDLFRHNPYDPYSLSSNQVRTIYQDKQADIWVGTVDGGLNKWNTQENKFIHYKNNPFVYNSLSHNHVRTILEDSRGNFWVGTDGGGLNLMNRETGTFTVFKHSERNPNSLSNNHVWDIYEDSKGNLWIATFGGGVCRFDYETRTFTAYQHDSKKIWSLADNHVTTILEDHLGNLWIGTYGGGLSKWDEETESFIPYKYSDKNPNSIGNNRIYSIFEDSDGILWVGTKGCLNRFDRENENFTRFDEANGFPNDVFMGILEDDNNNLWISTNRGLSKFNKLTYEIRNYDVRDGLQSNEFLVGSYCKASNGEMFFGGINGFNAFNPSDLKDNQHIPEIVITGFQVFNQEAELDTVISEKSVIRLEHDENFLSFDFVALDYIFPEKNQYAYKMDKVDKDWNKVGNRRFAIYNSLPPGKYVFQVIGSNNDEVWNRQGASITIIIEPAFWQTAWFKFLIGFMIVFFISSLVYLRIRRIKKQKERLEEEVRLRTAEIMKQKEDIQQKNTVLEQQKEEIEAQRDEIEAQRDEIEIQRDLATRQRDQISVQNKEITDSIIYAKRIQTAAIPADEFQHVKVQDHFTLFKPKDIVSGDFYWFSDKYDDLLILIAADCTGHGVPGAFMSMLGISLLNKIINEKNITHPTDILNRLRENIIRSLKQRGGAEDTKDGMDLALCTIDYKQNKVYFAGANNPLYFVRNKEVTIIKGDKMPIAIYDRMDAFTTHEIDMQKGDCIYLFSDGYPDQFGGPKGKKFKTKRFRKLLLENVEKPMEKQCQILDDTIETWKGDLEQVDDILVMGIRI